MPWSRQLWHVLAKDVREQRWWLLLYVLLLVIETTAGWRAAMATNGSTLFSGLLVLSRGIAALVICHGVFRADAPLEHSAYWVTLPLSRSALLCAKLAFVAIITCALPVLVHGAAWVAYGVPTVAVASAWWEHDASLTFAAIALAAFTAALRSGRRVAVLFLVVASAGTLLFERLKLLVPPPAPAVALMLVAAAIPLIVLAGMFAVYQRPRVTVRTRTSLVAVGTLALMIPALLAWASTDQADQLSSLLPNSQLTVRVVRDSVRSEYAAVRLLLTAPPPDRSLMVSATCAGSTSGRRSMTSFSKTAGQGRPIVPVLPSGLTWRTEQPWQRTTPASDVPLEFYTGGTRWLEGCAGAARYFVSIVRDSVVEVMPARDGATHVSAGRRLQVRYPNDNPGSLTFGLTVTSAPGHALHATADVRGEQLAPYFVLVHTERAEAILLSASELSNTPANTNLPLRTERFVTFAPENTDRPMRYSWDSLQFASEAAGLAWLDEAELYVIQRDDRVIDITTRVERALNTPSTTIPQPQAVP